MLAAPDTDLFPIHLEQRLELDRADARLQLQTSRQHSGIQRPVAEMTPTVMVAIQAKGLPMATAHCPTSSLSESPSTATGRSPALILITAMSVFWSSPTRASYI